jgi:ferredoxin
MPAIYFENEHKSLDVLPGTNLRKAALKSGIKLYNPLSRVFHVNVNLGSLKLPCSSDIIELVDGKGVNPRSPAEEKVLQGRILKRKLTPNLRLACQVQVSGDVRVRTRPAVEIDREETKRNLGFLAVLGAFGFIMLVIFILLGLDLVKLI